MTHTLHRRGSEESLRGEYVVIGIASGAGCAVGRAGRLRAFLDIVLKHDPISVGDMRTGNTLGASAEEIRAGCRDNSIVHAVLSGDGALTAALAELKEAGLGVSVTVSGLIEPVAGCCAEAGLTRHTAARSLGVFGKTEKLPGEEELEINTMCGHGMVGFPLIERSVERVRAGEATAEEAAVELARQCQCGVFHPGRAAGILRRLTSGEPRDAGGSMSSVREEMG